MFEKGYSGSSPIEIVGYEPNVKAVFSSSLLNNGD